MPKIIPPSSNHSVASSISNDSLTLDTSEDCKSVASKSPHYNGDKSETAYFWMMYIMYTGCTGSVHSQIENLCDNPNSTLQICHIKPTHPQLGLEVKCHFRYFKMGEKSPRTSQWTIGQCTAELKTPPFTLPVQEVVYLENEMKSFMSKNVNILKRKKNRTRYNGYKNRNIKT
jgi:hypothetical protein